jgi:hypothetical protein
VTLSFPFGFELVAAAADAILVAPSIIPQLASPPIHSHRAVLLRLRCTLQAQAHAIEFARCRSAQRLD